MNMQPPDNEEMTADDYVDMLYKELAESYEKQVAAEARIDELKEGLNLANQSMFESYSWGGDTPTRITLVQLNALDKYRDQTDNLSALREHDAQLLESVSKQSIDISTSLWLSALAKKIRAQG